MTKNHALNAQVRHHMQQTGLSFAKAKADLARIDARSPGMHVSAADLPETAPWTSASSDPYVIDLGVTPDGKAVWKLQSCPQALVTGTAGSGKSVIERTIAMHCLQHPDQWNLIGIDLKQMELDYLTAHESVATRIATTYTESLDALRYAVDSLERRYAIMGEQGVVNWQQADKSGEEDPRAIMIMVDEVQEILDSSESNEERGQRDAGHETEIVKLISKIARLGRAAAVHMVLATQRPETKVIGGELKANLGLRIVAGQVDTVASQLALGTDEATLLPPIRGRGIVQTNGHSETFQAYHIPVADMN